MIYYKKATCLAKAVSPGKPIGEYQYDTKKTN